MSRRCGKAAHPSKFIKHYAQRSPAKAHSLLGRQYHITAESMVSLILFTSTMKNSLSLDVFFTQVWCGGGKRKVTRIGRDLSIESLFSMYIALTLNIQIDPSKCTFKSE
ncbi:hypothetical protein GOP47_0027395 [Adiantum capillus-veneris]|nr:hypothetical protein GOP47_0027395 [Adiantum capillus-veneris]